MYFNKTFIGLLITVFFLFSKLYSQISEGGTPKSFIFSCEQSIQCIYMPKVNNDSLIMLDSIFTNDSTNFFSYNFNFGVSLKANYNFNSSGTWEVLADSSKLWRISLTSVGAYSNYLIFDDFFLPYGTSLFAYNKDKTQILGAYTYKNNKQDKRFSIGPIHGNTVILEYNQPKDIDTSISAEMNITSFIHSFKDIYVHNSFGSSGGCNINVKCPEGSNWCNQRRSVALIAKLSSTPGDFAAHCSGALVTNERRDGRPYVLTADHCIDGQNPSDFIFIFNYQSQACNNPTVAPTTTFSISGATTRANSPNSDFALLELSSKPPGSYNAYYSGWYNENERPESGVGIHHPKGDVKKISIYSDKPKRKIVDATEVWELQFDNGVVEPGSSGSPVFNENNLIVGQLLGTYSTDPISCDNTDGFALYGRLDKSWHEYGLSWLLNPNGTHSGSNQFYISSMSGDELCKENWHFTSGNDLHTSTNVNFTNPSTIGTRMYDGIYNASNNITAENVAIQSGTSVDFYGETIILKSGFIAERGCEFIASPQPCLRGCNTNVGRIDNSGGFKGEKSFIVMNTDNKKEDITPLTKINEFKLFPNPNTGNFTVYLEESSQAQTVTILNMLGEQVSQLNTLEQKLEINLSSYPKGVYFVNVQSNKGASTKKVVVN